MEPAKEHVLAISARVEAERIRPMFTASVDVPVSPKQVQEVLFSADGSPEANQSMLLVGRPNQALDIQNNEEYLTIKMGGEHPYTAYGWIDRANSRLITQGHWWYRGEYVVEPVEGGSRVTYRVYNIAPRSNRWLVPLMQWRFGAVMKAQLKALHQKCIRE